MFMQDGRMSLLFGSVATLGVVASTLAQATNTFPSSGSVGIGTVTPATKLTVYNNSNSGTATDNVETSIISVNRNASLILNSSQWYAESLIFQSNGTERGRILYYNDSNCLAFKTNVAERMRIDANGNVGIGTVSPGYPLDVNGQAAATGSVTIRNTGGGNSYLQFVNTNGSYWHVVNEPQNLNFYTGVYGSGTSRVTFASGGNVGIGVANPQARLDVGGQARVCSLQITGGCDLAEPFAIRGDQPSTIGGRPERPQIEPGMVVVIDPDHAGQLKLAGEPYDRKVAGIISGANGLSPGMVMTAANNLATRPADDIQHSGLSTQDSLLITHDSSLDASCSNHPVALTGRVWCWCDASYGAITPGDLLTTSATSGHAMRADEEHDVPRGCIIGKAMSKLEAGMGLVLVLVQPQ